jgi:hypothetical protein
LWSCSAAYPGLKYLDSLILPSSWDFRFISPYDSFSKEEKVGEEKRGEKEGREEREKERVRERKEVKKHTKQILLHSNL